jgi:Family of unknown function (DUF5906)
MRTDEHEYEDLRAELYDGDGAAQKHDGPHAGNVEAEGLEGRVGGRSPNCIIKTGTEASGNASVSARGAAIVVIRSDKLTFSKSYRLADSQLRKSQGAAVLVSGLSRLIEAPTATALTEIINKFTASNQALCVGRYTDRNLTEIRLTSKRNAEPGAIERNGENFGWNDGPGWVLLDVDYSAVDSDDAVFEMLFLACPALKQADVVIRRSTSWGISNAATGEVFDGGGWHVFVRLEDQRDAARFLEAMHARLWLAGCGFIRPGKNGRPYSKSPVDQLLEPERIVFEGKPELGAGLAQKPRPAIAYDGVALDSKTACRDLSDDEKADFARRVAEKTALAQPECDRIHAEWAEEQVAKRVALGVPEGKAREKVQHLCDGGELDDEHELHFKHLGVATLGQVLADVEKYRDKPMADPIESPEYAEDCAYVRVNPDGTVWINSYAHGETEYADLRAPERADVGDVFDGVEEQPKADSGASEAEDFYADDHGAGGSAKTTTPAFYQGIERRLTTIESLNARFALYTPKGEASTYINRRDGAPVTEADLKRRLSNEVVQISGYEGNPVCKPAFDVFTGNAKRHVYDRIAFTSKPTPDDTYNLYQGLGVTPAPGDCGRILEHVHEVICSGDEKTAADILKLMAWQIQNIGKPSRIVVVLKSEAQQVGEGVLLSTLAKIYGRSGFTPAAMEQVTGRFNDGLRGRAFVFLDEVVFSGDRRTADAIKSLSTASTLGIESKGLPVVQSPVAVNLWLASNHEGAAHIEETDARYWVHEVSAHRAGDAAYFAALVEEIENGGAEAFAHHLLTLDVSGFTPSRDVRKDTAAKRRMVRESLNPYDARRWLEDCCDAAQLLGGRTERSWEAGEPTQHDPSRR